MTQVNENARLVGEKMVKIETKWYSQMKKVDFICHHLLCTSIFIKNWEML
jgi:hypothetical protein